MKLDLVDGLLIGGAAVISVGASLFSLSVGLITLGAFLLCAGVLLTLGAPRRG